MNNIFFNSLGYFFFSWLISFGCSAIIFYYGKHFSLLDKAVVRSSHKGVVPKGGGISFLFITIFFIFWAKNYFWLVLICILAILSLIGDRKEIAYWQRLFLQCLCAAGLLFWAKPFFFEQPLWYFGFFIFLVASINFVNFMDGIDGIAGLHGVVSFFCLGCYAFWQQQLNLAFFCFLMFFTIWGFLPWNFLKNKKIFMGDVGSVFLGATISMLILLLSESWFAFFQLCFLLYFFYADCILTLVIKKIRNIKFSEPHRLHFYQLLANEINIHHWLVATGYALVQFFCMVVLFLFVKNWWSLFCFYSVVSFFFVLFYFGLRKVLTKNFF